MRPGHVPTPFSDVEIRRACPPEHYRVFSIQAPGAPGHYRVLRFERSGPPGLGSVDTWVVSEMRDPHGRIVGEVRRSRASWKALQHHASFPRSRTRVTRATRQTPAGSFETWRYEVRSPEGEGSGVRVYWFATSLPGPPVEYVHRKAGRTVFRMVLLAHGEGTPVVPPAPPRRPPAEKRPAAPSQREAPPRRRTRETDGTVPWKAPGRPAGPARPSGPVEQLAPPPAPRPGGG